jgi:endonuclease G, mitochondrial
VSDYERHRNAAIFERQGNRNPLIDHPEWAQHLAFT